jgi:hypothetical protein
MSIFKLGSKLEAGGGPRQRDTFQDFFDPCRMASDGAAHAVLVRQPFSPGDEKKRAAQRKTSDEFCQLCSGSAGDFH